jgi:hypothetical protein
MADSLNPRFGIQTPVRGVPAHDFVHSGNDRDTFKLEAAPPKGPNAMAVAGFVCSLLGWVGAVVVGVMAMGGSFRPLFVINGMPAGIIYLIISLLPVVVLWLIGAVLGSASSSNCRRDGGALAGAAAGLGWLPILCGLVLWLFWVIR